jgi:hypothetical protein
MTEGTGGGALLRRIVVLLTVVALMAVMLVASVAPAFARTTFGPANDPQDPALCVHGVAQTFGPDPDHSARDALKAFCYLPGGKQS